jgi:hypothetical protein
MSYFDVKLYNLSVLDHDANLILKYDNSFTKYIIMICLKRIALKTVAQTIDGRIESYVRHVGSPRGSLARGENGRQ